MKIFLILFIYMSGIFSETSIYDINIEIVQGQVFNMAQCRGKKILISVIRPDSLQNQKLNFLDSVKEVNPNLVIIVIPATDFIAPEEIVAAVNNNPSSGLILVAPSAVKKSAGETQHPLMKWLTDIEQNSHFDAEVKSDDQLYFVSESGVLYAVLERSVPLNVIAQTLATGDITE
jgi:glutathione peroxidase-family protein